MLAKVMFQATDCVFDVNEDDAGNSLACATPTTQYITSECRLCSIQNTLSPLSYVVVTTSGKCRQRDWRETSRSGKKRNLDVSVVTPEIQKFPVFCGHDHFR